MHRSRIGVVLIDHPAGTFDQAAAFWAAARGGERSPAPAEADPFAGLDDLPGGVELALQRTGEGTPARVHLDIESDDVDAEIARVVALGARIVERHDGYAILADPGGLVFCVVGVQTGDAFAEHATSWPRAPRRRPAVGRTVSPPRTVSPAPG